MGFTITKLNGDNVMKTQITTDKYGISSVTYFSVYQQRWIDNANYVPDEELAAMNQVEREEIIEHLNLGDGYDD